MSTEDDPYEEFQTRLSVLLGLMKQLYEEKEMYRKRCIVVVGEHDKMRQEIEILRAKKRGRK